MRVEWTADALADLERISTWIEKERTLALANRMALQDHQNAGLISE
jgi:plasmid stabilization system protein ParE